MPRGIYNQIECDVGNHSTFTPQEHQKMLLDYFLTKLKHKGVVAFHQLGSGKSCSSILISDAMIRASKVQKVYVLTPGSLRRNFIDEYCEKCGYKPEYLKKYYTFITTNYSVGYTLPDFNNSLVIIDEVHNLIKGVKNQSMHTTLIYNNLMKSDCKILALTGTPIYNYIWEWPLLGNLLKPGTFANIIRKKGQLDTDSFMDSFNTDIDGNVTPKDPHIFNNKLKGIVSYFPGISGKYYPDVINEKPIQVRMTPLQDKTYWKIVKWERYIRAEGPPVRSLLKKNPSEYNELLTQYMTASKYIMSRMMSNCYYPAKIKSTKHLHTNDDVQHIGKVLKYKYTPSGEISDNKKYFNNLIYNMELTKRGLTKDDIDNDKKIKDKVNEKVKRKVDKYVKKEELLVNIGWINKSMLKNHMLSDVYSRKILALITNIVSHWNSKHVLFTFFKTKSGVNLIHSLFKLCGIKTEIYSGDSSQGKRNKILKEFNSEKNRYGDKIKLLLFTDAGAEGINILETQHMHILESSIVETHIQQAIGRVVRYKSHMVDGRKPMPKHEQVVHIWRYWSISSADPIIYVNESTNKTTTIINKATVDYILYEKGRKSINQFQSFLKLLKNASVTPYNKTYDNNNKLPEYDIDYVGSSKLNKAYNTSDKRYEKNYDKVFWDNIEINDIV